MKLNNRVATGAALFLASGAAQAQVRDYWGTDTLETFTTRLVFHCASAPGPVYPALIAGEFNYVSVGNTAPGNQMRNGVQDIAPQSRKLSLTEFCDNDIPAGPQDEPALNATVDPTFTPGSKAQNLVVALDGITAVTSELSSRRCDDDANSDDDFLEGTNDDFGATLAFSGSLAISSPVPAIYTLADWRDVLRILYTGGNLNDSVPSTFPPPTAFTEATRLARCGSPIRRALVASWDNIVQDVAGASACGDTPGSCQDAAGDALPLRHLFRRDDMSGTTETFLALLGLPNSALNVPFCNGWGGSTLSPTPPRQTSGGGLVQDDDPIRVTCTNNTPAPAGPILDDEDGTGGLNENASKLNDETCGWDRQVGLLRTIRVPALLGTTNTSDTTVGNGRPAELEDLYPRVNCLQGVFDIRRPPDQFHFASPPACPDGAPYLFTGCLTPLAAETRTGSAFSDPLLTSVSFDCNCVNSWTNRAPGSPDRNPSLPGIQNDGRSWNRYYRGPRLDRPWRNPANSCPVLRDETGVQVQLADTRIKARSTTVAAAPGAPAQPVVVPPGRICKEQDATRQIGCLARASECALGITGREGIIDTPNDDQTSASTKDLGTEFNGGTALRIGPAAGDGSAPVRVAGSVGAGETKGYGPAHPALLSAVPGASGYQLVRRLYFNSIVGFENVLYENAGPFTAVGRRLPGISGAGNEASELIQCLFEKPDALAQALADAGFLPLGLTPATAIPVLDPAPFTCQ